MTRQEFDASLAEATPPPSFGRELTSLWWISRNQWQRAHDLVDNAPGPDAAWVHAYLHRVEGDDANAGYWYRRAGKTKPNLGLSKERDALLEYFLSK